MNQATQPVRGRASVLTAVAIAVAVVASLALAQFAAAANPVAKGGKTTLTLNSGLVNKLKKAKIKLSGVSPATVSGKVVTLPIAIGSIDTAGAGELEHEGGIKFKAGKKSVAVSTLTLLTSSSALNAKVGGKTMKFATVSGLSAARNGFGTNITISSLKLTGKAAKELNKKLALNAKPKKKKKKKNKRASASKAKKKAAKFEFKANQVLGGSLSETQPKTLGVQATSNVSLVLSPQSIKKLQHVGTPPYPEGASPVAVQLSPIAPTQVTSASPLTVAFPFGPGGTLGPSATAGVLQTLGGLKLTQNLESVPPFTPGDVTTLTMGNIWLDLETDRASVEVLIQNPKRPEANLSFPRTSIANVSLAGATVKSDSTAHTVTVENATATLEETTALVLNQVFIEGLEKGGLPPQEKFAAGDQLGTFSFTATTE